MQPLPPCLVRMLNEPFEMQTIELWPPRRLHVFGLKHVVERRRANQSISDRPPGARVASSNAARP
eukprot:5531654-Prymnesium_polylepis.1